MNIKNTSIYKTIFYKQKNYTMWLMPSIGWNIILSFTALIASFLHRWRHNELPTATRQKTGKTRNRWA